MQRLAPWLAVAWLGLGGCLSTHRAGDGDGGGGGDGDGDGDGDGVSCTDILVVAVTVEVIDTQGRPLNADGVQVTVAGGLTLDCDGSDGVYACYEQAGSQFDVLVEYEGTQQVQSASLEYDGCHITNPATLTFVFERAAQCEVDTDCWLVDTRCCACEPPGIDDVIAVVDPESVPVCGALCGACPEPIPAPQTVVPRCLSGSCEAVDIREQDYTECNTDADCVLVPTYCCGFCGPIGLGNAFAVNPAVEMQFYTCHEAVSCPPVDCDVELTVEARCGEDRHCSVVPL